jgi:hypothetical protein
MNDWRFGDAVADGLSKAVFSWQFIFGNSFLAIVLKKINEFQKVNRGTVQVFSLQTFDRIRPFRLIRLLLSNL